LKIKSVRYYKYWNSTVIALNDTTITLLKRLVVGYSYTR